MRLKCTQKSVLIVHLEIESLNLALSNSINQYLDLIRSNKKLVSSQYSFFPYYRIGPSGFAPMRGTVLVFLPGKIAIN